MEAYDAGLSWRSSCHEPDRLQSHRDGFAVAFDKNVMEKRLADMLDERLSDDDQRRYGLTDNRDWQVPSAELGQKRMPQGRIVPCDCRPFDRRFCMLDNHDGLPPVALLKMPCLPTISA